MAQAGEGGFVCMPYDADEEKWRFNDPLLSTGLLWFEHRIGIHLLAGLIHGLSKLMISGKRVLHSHIIAMKKIEDGHCVHDCPL